MDIIIYQIYTVNNILTNVCFSSRGATIEVVFKNPFFTAYKSASVVDIDSLISKLFYLIHIQYYVYTY